MYPNQQPESSSGTPLVVSVHVWIKIACKARALYHTHESATNFRATPSGLTAERQGLC